MKVGRPGRPMHKGRLGRNETRRKLTMRKHRLRNAQSRFKPGAHAGTVDKIREPPEASAKRWGKSNIGSTRLWSGRPTTRHHSGVQAQRRNNEVHTEVQHIVACAQTRTLRHPTRKGNDLVRQLLWAPSRTRSRRWGATRRFAMSASLKTPRVAQKAKTPESC